MMTTTATTRLHGTSEEAIEARSNSTTSDSLSTSFGNARLYGTGGLLPELALEAVALPPRRADPQWALQAISTLHSSLRRTYLTAAILVAEPSNTRLKPPFTPPPDQTFLSRHSYTSLELHLRLNHHLLNLKYTPHSIQRRSPSSFHMEQPTFAAPKRLSYASECRHLMLL